MMPCGAQVCFSCEAEAIEIVEEHEGVTEWGAFEYLVFERMIRDHYPHEGEHK